MQILTKHYLTTFFLFLYSIHSIVMIRILTMLGPPTMCPFYFVFDVLLFSLYWGNACRVYVKCQYTIQIIYIYCIAMPTTEPTNVPTFLHVSFNCHWSPPVHALRCDRLRGLWIYIQVRINIGYVIFHLSNLAYLINQ